MKKNLMTTLGEMKKVGERQAPGILAGLAIVCVGLTLVSGIRAGMKINEVLKDKKEDLGDVDPDDKDAKKAVIIEGVKEVLPEIILPTVMAGLAIGCIYESNKISYGRIATLSMAYTISEKALKDVDKKIVDVVGEKKAKTIHDEIIKEKVKEKEESNDRQVIVTGRGEVTCYDSWHDRLFKSNAESIEKAILKAANEILSMEFISLADFYEILGLSIPVGSSDQEFGWNRNDLVGNELPIMITCELLDGEPCLALDFSKARPRLNYEELTWGPDHRPFR